MGKSRGEQITERQLRILILRAEGKSYAEIGDIFGITGSGASATAHDAARFLVRKGINALPVGAPTTFTIEELVSSVLSKNDRLSVSAVDMKGSVKTHNVPAVIGGVTKNLIDAMMAYAEEGSWADSDVIDALVGVGITHEDFCKAGYGDFVKEYFEDFDESFSSLENQIAVAERNSGNMSPAKKRDTVKNVVGHDR